MKKKFRFYALKLCGIIILAFLAQLMIPYFNELFVLDASASLQIWRFATSIFLHAGLAHLIYNLFALALFGSILEKIIGGQKFMLVFFGTGILANFVAINFYDISLGASGAIFGIIGMLVALRPGLIVWAFGMPMPLFIAGAIWAVGDILGAYGFLVGNPIDNTGNIAHLSGMFFGFLFGLMLRAFRRKRHYKARAQIQMLL